MKKKHYLCTAKKMIKGLQNPLTFFNKKKSLAVLLFGKKALPLHRKKDKVSPLKTPIHYEEVQQHLRVR